MRYQLLFNNTYLNSFENYTNAREELERLVELGWKSNLLVIKNIY